MPQGLGGDRADHAVFVRGVDRSVSNPTVPDGIRANANTASMRRAGLSSRIALATVGSASGPTRPRAAAAATRTPQFLVMQQVGQPHNGDLPRRPHVAQDLCGRHAGGPLLVLNRRQGDLVGLALSLEGLARRRCKQNGHGQQDGRLDEEAAAVVAGRGVNVRAHGWHRWLGGIAKPQADVPRHLQSPNPQIPKSLNP